MKLVKVKSGKYKTQDGAILFERISSYNRAFRPASWEAWQMVGLNFKLIAYSDSLADLKAQVARRLA